LEAFALLWLAIVPTPGPNTLLILHLALTASWRDIALALLGNLLAIALYALATLLGISLLLAAAPSVRLAVHVLGGGYLVRVGIGLVRAGSARRKFGTSDAELSLRGGRPFARGILTALANVQALLFLTSIFAAVGILNSSPATKLAAVAIIVSLNGAYLGLLAWLLQRQTARTVFERYRPIMEIGFGIAFAAFGARLVGRELAAFG
jgi:threonine/homoserine/homoserine lactone efflux protein